MNSMQAKILAYLAAESYRPLRPHMLYRQIGKGTRPKAFFAALAQLQEGGEILSAPNGTVILAANRPPLPLCIFHRAARGFGFAEILHPEGEATSEKEEIFIPESATGGAMHGDTVRVAVTRFSHGGVHDKPEGAVRKIETRAVTDVIGTLEERRGRTRRKVPLFVLIPDDRRIALEIEVEPTAGLAEKSGEKAQLRITRYPNGTCLAAGRILRTFGKSGTKGANYEAILAANGIRTEFPAPVRSAAVGVSAERPVPDGRRDLRDQLIFTVDGADAKDLDDALSLQRQGAGYLRGVHIADVSAYVRRDSALDGEAFLRGSSVYFTDQVVPMLPKELSNGICSLHPGVDRYAMSAWMTLDAQGAILDCRVEESILRSKIRGVYSEVNALLAQGEACPFYEKYAPLFPDTLPIALELYEKLARRSTARGALELATAEARILLDEKGEPVDILRRERGTAEKMIEQFMLCANEAVATLLIKADFPCVYRIHEDPPQEKIRIFSRLSHNLGLSVGDIRPDRIRPAQLQKVLAQAEERGIGQTVSFLLLRSLSKAKYSAAPARHFGLGISTYCHFTSPIRRYPDLSVHRILKAMLHGDGEESKEALRAFAKRSAEASSENELRVINAEREIDALYKTLFLAKQIGKEADGIVSSVTGFGLFVQLENTCEGLVPLATLPGRFVYDPETMRLSCGLTCYQLGQRVRVRIEDADPDNRKVSLRLISPTDP